MYLDSPALREWGFALGFRVSGDVCFDCDGAPGEYVLLYEASIWDTDRYAWVSER